MTGISIIIPTYNRADYLGPTLESVARLECPTDVAVEVIVIDNRCTDRTVDVVEEFAKTSPFPVRCVYEELQGLCFGRNRGMAEATHDHLIYLDDDIRVSPEWLMGYLEAVNEHGGDAVTGPVQPLFEEEKPAYLQGRVLHDICSPYSRKGDDILVLPAELASELPGCNFGVKKAAAETVNGFDVTLDRVGDKVVGGGDSDFGLRLSADGYKTVYHPKCWIEHVMVPEKLTKPYLRKRAIGTGTAVRKMQHNRELSLIEKARYLGGIASKWAVVLALKATGQSAQSFDKELEALKAWSFLVTKPDDGKPSIPKRPKDVVVQPQQACRAPVGRSNTIG